ncbi:MAG TPA: hypothetical protein VMJ64_03340 [Anaerolineales bacterium]|nr:hypothetical protein [Anaerolineales bacterium]
MAPEKIEEQFTDLVERLIRLRPKLALSDDNMASIKRQLRELHEKGHDSHEDMAFLFRIPIILSQRETPPTMGELSAELGIPLSSATRMADWLVEVNVAERCNDPHDRRVVRLCMTEHGRELIDLSREFMKARILQVLRHLTDAEQRQLLRLMKKLIDSIEAEE